MKEYENHMTRTVTKRIVSLLLILLVCAPTISHGEEVDGHILDNETFFATEIGYRRKWFDRALSSVSISDTQSFFFVPDTEEHLLANLTLVSSTDAAVVKTAEDAVESIGQLVSIAKAVQDGLKDGIAFSYSLLGKHAATGIGYLVGDEDIWLWSENRQAVMLPIVFYDETSGDLVDDVYLMVVAKAAEGNGYVALYNDKEIVADYLTQVEVNSEASDFQRVIIQWFVHNYDEIMGSANVSEENAPVSDGMTRDSYIGIVTVTSNKSINVREEATQDSELAGVVRSGQWFYVLSIAENGWYEIQLAYGVTGYVSPILVKFTKLKGGKAP